MQATITKSMLSSQATQPVALLHVSRDDGWNAEHQLDAEGMVIIGSSDRCGLSLSGGGVAAMHCSLRRDEAGIWLSDWESPGGTFLEGARVTRETHVQPGSTIQIGPYTIRLGLSEPGQINESQLIDSTDRTAAPELVGTTPAPQKHLASPAVVTGSSNEPIAAFPFPEHVPSLERTTTSGAGNTAELTPSAHDREELETVDMLRAEVEQLQYELAERDAQLAEFMRPLDAHDTRADETSSDQLLGRIEELLEELDRSDARMAMLEELLVASEEANGAEREERRQLESWVADIEALVSEHDKNRNTELETLKQQVASLVLEREELMQQLSQHTPGSELEQADSEEVARLRVQITHLGQQLCEAHAAVARSKDELRLCETQLVEANNAKRELREEHLKLAEERAAVTRLRAAITAEQAELPTRPPNPQTDVDSRVREFRQHLREIHEQEKQEHQARRLSTRIAQLWKHVERPRPVNDQPTC